MRVLVLGGTAEARALAAVLVERRTPVVSSLAGRVRDPALPAGEVRIGGFGTAARDGIEGLTAFLRERSVTTVVDATHPFAATISAHAVTAAARAGVPLLRLQRPGWSSHPDAGSWVWVDSAAEAVAAGQAHRRPVLTTGRQGLADFLPWSDKPVTVRVVDPPEIELPAGWRVIRSRGPYSYPDERDLLGEADLLVTKDSGGAHTAAKLDAARDLGVSVLVIRRPPAPAGVATYATVVELLDALPIPDPEAGRQASESSQARCSPA